MKQEKNRLKKVRASLDLVVEFVNSKDLQTEQDAWTDPASLGRWLTQHALTPEGVVCDEADLQRARAARGMLRELVRVGSRRKLDPEARELLELLTSEAVCRVRFDDDLVGRPAPASADVAGIVGYLFAVVMHAQSEGLWSRCNLCIRPQCGRVFYDDSRNRSGRWCSRRCSNYVHAQTYRRRHDRKK